MKNALIKNTLRSVKNTLSRFIAIFAIIAIGCGFFAGVKAAGPDMKESAWDYYNNQNLADIHIISTLGFETDEVEGIAANENTDTAEYGYSADLFIFGGEVDGKIVKAYSYSGENIINVPEIKEGRMPQNSSECVVDYKFYSASQPAIGEKITLETGDDRDINDIMSSNEYTVVGYIQSPIYIAFERGTSAIGNGVVNGFVLIPEENFTSEVYTDVYVTVKNAQSIDPFTDKYSDLIDSSIESFEAVGEVQIEKRVQKITDEAYEEINDAKDELSDAKDEYADGETEYNDGLRAVDNLNDAVEKLNEIIATYETNAATADEVTDKINSLNQGEFFAVDTTLEQLITGYMMMPAAFDDGTKAMAKGGIEQYIEELEKTASDTQQELSDAKAELDDAKVKIADAEVEIADAEADVAEATNDAKWYVFNRDDYNPYYSHYGEDCDRVDAIASVFPLFFILVAALVCWTTMTRMVEEQRTQIGTLKALGYSRYSIIMQYIVYAIAASIPGAFFGLAIGFKALPTVIFVCYQSMYAQQYLMTPFRWDYAIGCVVAACLCTGISSLYASRKELVARPAQLMRPKPPKNGKRIFLEYITPLWKRMKFTFKVTFRNLFRYKSRVLMTIIGVAGCTALLLTGFGLRYSIISIVDRQYIDIFSYDALAALDDKQENYDELISVIDETGVVSEKMLAMQKTCDIYNSSGDTAEVYIVVPQDSSKIKNYIGMHERVSKKELELTDDGIIINEKLSRELNVDVGDTLYINEGYNIKIAGVMENYTFNYIYMTESCYNTSGFETSVKNNILYMNMSDTSQEDILSEAIINRDDVLAVTYSLGGGDKFRNLVSSLSMIVIAIIVSAGALAFVVLFNLANINVNERVHELATIKVLGFYDGEVASYIYRENTISAVLGMLAGLVLGVFLERFVVKTAEVDAVMFAPDIPIQCFLFAAGMTLIFAVAVNIFLYFRLKKIDMAASLKAIE